MFLANGKAASMKYERFELILKYQMTSMLRGKSIKRLHDPARDTVELLFSALEHSFIYLPADKEEFEAAACGEFARHGKPVPHEFSAFIQHFVNSQLHYIAHRAISGAWAVEREVRYCSTSKHTADLRIAVPEDEDSYHSPFNIWIESDHARDSRVLRKNWEKVMIVLGGEGGGRDIFVQFLFRTREFKRLETVASALLRSISVGRSSFSRGMSFVVAYITPSYLRAHEVVDSNLVLFKDTSLRINDCYFHGWTRDADFWLLNERIDRASSS
jgi:hypothetical protein